MTTAPTSNHGRPATAGGTHVMLSAADFEILMSELEALRHTATHAGAGPGAIVRVSDRAGRVMEYELVAGHDATVPRERVPIGSPVGEALLGALPGDVISLTLPNGRRRRVRIVSVESEGRACPPS